MKASKLLNEIRENLKDYPIDYLKNKVTDDRYKDPLTKSLAKYNSGVYDEIYEKELENDFNIEFQDSELALGLYYDMNDVVAAVAAKLN